MLFILAVVSALWGYSLTMTIMVVVVILYACVAYRVKQGETMAE